VGFLENKGANGPIANTAGHKPIIAKKRDVEGSYPQVLANSEYLVFLILWYNVPTSRKRFVLYQIALRFSTSHPLVRRVGGGRGLQVHGRRNGVGENPPQVTQ